MIIGTGYDFNFSARNLGLILEHSYSIKNTFTPLYSPLSPRRILYVLLYIFAVNNKKISQNFSFRIYKINNLRGI